MSWSSMLINRPKKKLDKEYVDLAKLRQAEFQNTYVEKVSIINYQLTMQRILHL